MCSTIGTTSSSTTTSASCRWTNSNEKAPSSSSSLFCTNNNNTSSRRSNSFCCVSASSMKQQSALQTTTPAASSMKHQSVLQTKSKSQNGPNKKRQKWNIIQRIAAKVLDLVESEVIMNHERAHPLPKTVDPNVQISGNFAPVPEHPPSHSLPIDGVIPPYLNGVYLRNGANPLHKPLAGHHLFDGDGMIHAVTISNSTTASYTCRFTHTNRFMQELEIGRQLFPKPIGELHGHTGIARLLLFFTRVGFGLLDNTKGIGVANAGLVYFNNRLLAMSEDDKPYHVRVTSDHDLETIGRFDFNGQLTTSSSMIAHPKIDSVTGEMFALSYDVIRKPYLKYFRFSSTGVKSADVEIELEQPTMTHDFAITENLVVIPDQQVVFNLTEMVKGGNPVVYDESKISRFGFLHKYATDDQHILWIDCPPDTFCFHLWNAWEDHETGEVVVICSCMTPPDSIFNENDSDLETILSEIRFNLTTLKSTRRPIINHKLNLEVGMVNRNLLGRKTRFAYLALAEPWPKVSGFAKVDLITGEVKKFLYGGEKYGGEPFFLPKSNITGLSADEPEDEGTVLVFVHDEVEGRSELLIVNAVTLEKQASVKLPSRVPYGFHGTFIRSDELKDQI